ncbi:MAG: S41 family peptidase [Clostridia bacterium]|nr:S41 family peptidase [Clostridia bacterium]MCL6521619.1 S41 family peptidase [Bacillota bacterium]
MSQPFAGQEPPAPPRRPGPSWRAAVAGALLIALLAGSLGYAVADQRLASALRGLPTTSEDAATLRQLQGTPAFQDFLQTLTLIRTRYVDAPDMQKVLAGATSGALAALHDPYSVYFDRSAFTSFSSDTTGEYGGIGVQVTEQGSYVVVQTPFPKTPSATTPYEGAKPGDPVGLRPGDRIVQVDGRNVTGTGVDAVAQMIRGKPGTTVVLGVDRPLPGGHDVQHLVFRMVRANVVVPTVQSKMLPGSVGYLQISQFTEKTPPLVRQALDRLRGQGMRALVLDLRYNPGGSLDAVEQIAGMFLPGGSPIVHTVDRSGRRQTATVPGDGKGIGVPLAVLVNGASASASEILSGALQDLGVGTLVGERTFGKGLVQQIYPFPDGTGIKLTVERYLTASGRDINKHVDPRTGQTVGGIQPNVTVKAPSNWDTSLMGKPGQDPQLDAALGLLEQQLRGGAGG